MNTSDTTHAVTIATEHKRLRALQLREQGEKYRDIARAMGISVAYAHLLVVEGMASLHEQVMETAQQARMLELNRLDKLWFDLQQLAARHSDPAKVGGNPDILLEPRYIDAQLKIMERRARLLGLDAPQQVAGPNGGPIPIAAVDARDVLLRKVNEMAERLAAQAVAPVTPEVGSARGVACHS